MKIKKLITCLSALLLLFSSCSIDEDEPIVDVNQNLVAYYPFSGNTLDESKNDYDAEAKGATLTFDRFMTPKSAYAFNGIDSQIIIPSIESLNSFKEFTINLWVKTDAIAIQQILHKAASNKKGMHPAYSIALGNNEPEYEDDEILTNDIIFSTAPENFVQDLRMFNYEINNWYMITCVLQNDVMFLYINGKPAVLRYIDGEISSESFPILLGNNPEGKMPFKGVIDDVRIYNKAKSVDFVSYLYDN